MTKTLAKSIPALGKQDWKGKEAIVYAHYFYWGRDWYVLEFDWENEFFGLVIWLEIEYGSFTLEELESTGKIERDLYWDKKKIGEIAKLREYFN